MKEKVKQALNVIMEKFKAGNIPEAVAYSMFPVSDIPSAKWSLLNRTLMFLSGTADGRGYRQWQQVGRFVKKGSKAFYILVPFIKKIDDENGDPKETLLGFGTKPVFRVEDTDGQPLDYQNIEVPHLPLLKRAEQWGISVKAIPGNYKYYGYYASNRNEIALAAPDECVFFHELAHAAHHKYKGKLKNGQDPLQEIVAELSAQIRKRFNAFEKHRLLHHIKQMPDNEELQKKLNIVHAVKKPKKKRRIRHHLFR